MKKKVFGFLLSAALTIGTIFTGATDVSAAAPLFTGNYFGSGFDSYESGTMEISDGWSNGDMFDCTWRASNVKFNNGIMNLSINRDYSGYTGAEYRTRQAFGYGMYDVSMKAIKNDGVVTSFFTYTGPSDGTTWDEIDIEILGKDTTKVQFNYYTNGVANHEYLYNLGFDASQGFHQYGFYWDANSITWYVDKKPVYTATRDIPKTPGHIMMNTWNGRGVDEWLKPFNGRTGLTASYDWFSYTKPGASSTTTTTTTTTNNNNNTSYNSGSFSSTQKYSLIASHSGKALDVSYGSKDNGANVLQYRYSGYENQKWYLVNLNNGYYKIQSAASGKVLETAYYSSDNGANIQQWEFNGALNQQWKIENVNGNYKIINRLSGKALDVSGRSTADNANVLLWGYSGAANQLWKITAVN